MSSPNFELGPVDRDLYLRATKPYLKLSTAGVLSAINGGSISGATIDNAALITAGVGTWTAQPFNAADYTGNASMTVTVASGDVAVNSYSVVGSTMFWRLVVTGITVAGTPSNQIRVTVPGGLQGAGSVQGTYYYSNNGTPGIGLFQLSGATLMVFQKLDATAWAAATDTTEIRAQIILSL